jgi:hypothetical protein
VDRLATERGEQRVRRRPGRQGLEHGQCGVGFGEAAIEAPHLGGARIGRPVVGTCGAAGLEPARGEAIERGTGAPADVGGVGVVAGRQVRGDGVAAVAVPDHGEQVLAAGARVSGGRGCGPKDPGGSRGDGGDAGGCDR